MNGTPVSQRRCSRAIPAVLSAALVAASLGTPVRLRAAEAAAPAPPVDDLVREALSRSPTVAAAAARLAAARNEVAPAGALPDPMLEVMVQSVGPFWDPMRQMTMGQVQYTQPLPWPGKQAARRDAAGAMAGMRLAEVEDARRMLVMQVRAAYARVFLLDRELESLGTARELLEVLAAAAASRYAAGQGEQEAIVKAQLEASRLEARRADLEAERASWVATPNRLLDRPAGAGLGVVAALPAVDAAGEALVDRALRASPEIAMRRAAVQAAEKRLESARLESRPNFLVGMGVGSSLMPEPVVTLRFGLELPVWSRQKTEPMVARARADLLAATEDLRAAEAGVRAEAEQLAARWRRDQQQIVRYREAIVPQSAVALDAARSAYLAGRGDFSMVVEDFRMWIDARVMLAGREADRFVTWAELERIAAPQDATEGEGE